MYKIIQYGFITCCIYLVQGCCTKMACEDHSFAIEFHDFSIIEIDTIIVYTYTKEQHFTTLMNVDTLSSNYSPSGSNAYISRLQMIYKFNDYIIKIPGAGLMYHITELDTERSKCNTCFATRDQFYPLQRYKLNGFACNQFPLVVNK